MADPLTYDGRLYREDRIDLHHALTLAEGIDLSEPVVKGQWVHLGNAIVTDTVVQVFVRYFPAVFFWKFMLVFSDGDSKTVTTGSGHFNRYWKAVQLIANEMLTVKEGIIDDD